MKKTRRIGYVFHTPETESSAFKCPYCDKAYKTEASLNKHITKVHSDKAEDKNENKTQE